MTTAPSQLLSMKRLYSSNLTSKEEVKNTIHFHISSHKISNRLMDYVKGLWKIQMEMAYR